MTNHTLEIDTCPHCGSNNLKTLTADAEPTLHYGRIICCQCDHFIKWLRNPALSEAHEHRTAQLNRLLTSHQLTIIETRFVKSILPERWLTSAQTEWLDKILERVLGECSPVQPTNKNPPNKVGGLGFR